MSKRSRLQGRIEGLEALLEVSAVDIGNQVKAIKALGTEAVDLYKQFNQNFGEIMVGKIKAKVPKDSGSLASSIRSAKLQDGVVIRVGTPAKHPYARLVEFGGYNPYTTTIRKSIGSKNFGATATLKVRNPLSRKLWKAQRKEGYFFYPSIKEELPKFQADYIKALDNLVESLYSRFS
jgi:hypothetical protein